MNYDVLNDLRKQYPENTRYLEQTRDRHGENECTEHI